jgi:hypothetical protein
MLTSCHFLFPSLHLLLLRECVGFQDTVHHLSDLPLLLNPLHSTLEALDLCSCLIAILLGLGGDSKLGELLRRLVAVLTLAGALDVHRERVLRLLCVLAAVDTLACTAAVEAVQANI